MPLTPILERLDQELSDIACLQEAVLFIAENAGEDHARRLRHLSVGLLYLQGELLRDAARDVGHLTCQAAPRPPLAA